MVYEQHFQTLKYGWVMLIFDKNSTIMQMPPIQPPKEVKGRWHNHIITQKTSA